MIAIEMPTIRYVMGSEAKRYSYWAEVGYGSHYIHGPYQVKNGPAVALVAAAGTISAGAAAGGILGGIMIAGGIASALGSITGNKTLSTIGTVASIASVGYGAFTDAAGNFVNPLSDFGSTQLGGALGNIKDGIGKFFSDLTGGANQTVASVGGQTGDMIASAASDVIPDTTASGLTQSLIDSAPGQGVKFGESALSGAAPANTASAGGGLLNSALGGRDVLNLGLGLSQGYQQGQLLDQRQPLIDAQVDAQSANTNMTNLQAQQLQNRMNNMQAQPEVGMTVNQDANVFQGNTQPQGKMLVIVNGQVQYVTPQEAQVLSQGGLLNSGAA